MAALRAGRNDTVSVVQRNRAADGVDAAPQYPIESVDNALKLLLLLGEKNELRLTDASKHLGVATSTAHRILAMLQWRGFVRQDPRTKTYGPGPSLTTIAFSVLRKMDIPQIVQPILEELSHQAGETVHLGTLDGNSTRFLAVSEPTTAVRVASRLGKEMPAHCTSTGKVLLAQLPREQLDRLYPDEQLSQVTPQSIRTKTELLAQLDLVAKQGYATNREESEEGGASVAVAVPSASGLRLAINASAPVFRLPPRKVKTLVALLDEAAVRLADLTS